MVEVAIDQNMTELTSFEIVDGSILKSIRKAFSIPEDDSYVYKTEGGGVTMGQAQAALDNPSYKYRYYQGDHAVDVPSGDIEAYTNIYKSSIDPENGIKSFFGNAKKNSPRQGCAAYQITRRHMPRNLKADQSKRKRHLNPYLDLWMLACQQLGFLGPIDHPGYADPKAVKQSHPLLPIFMHHFGCGIPSWEAINTIKLLTGKLRCFDVGCGNGYWTWLLRKEGVQVEAVDDCSSKWRTMWINDVQKVDAVSFLKRRSEEESVLLMVYPIVGGGNLTTRIIDAFKGNIIILVGTQNANRYTTFKDMTTEEFFKKRAEWFLFVRIMLPSFPGKDDAMYVYVRQSSK